MFNQRLLIHIFMVPRQVRDSIDGLLLIVRVRVSVSVQGQMFNLMNVHTHSRAPDLVCSL